MNSERMKVLEKALARKMPFGKYKGQTLEDIPDSYLEWASSAEWTADELAVDMDFVLVWRNETGTHVY
uniref:Putative quorum-sensing-regulated virulence factor n=1 Tax=viral metagenome TaxID=1070528 RepID=A0A6H1ZMB8_9ZZZZ